MPCGTGSSARPAPRLLSAGVRGLSINVHDGEAAPAPSPAPAPEGEAPHVAEVSVWLDSYERRDEVEAALGELGRSRIRTRPTWWSSPSMTTTEPHRTVRRVTGRTASGHPGC